MHKATLPLYASIFLTLSAGPVHAGESGITHENPSRATATGNDYEPPSHNQNLEQRLTPEQRQELYQDLQSQSEAAYSDQPQIESRRQVMRKKMHERLQQADTDNDNSVSRIEAEESMPGLAKHFDEIDFNHDGVITLEEMKAEDERRRELREQKKKRESQLKLQEAEAQKKQLKKTKSRKKARKPKVPEVQQPT